MLPVARVLGIHTHTLGYLPVPALFALTLMALWDADAGAGAGVCVVQLGWLVGVVSCQGCNLVF